MKENVCVIVMINHVFISFSAVQIYDIPYIHLCEQKISPQSERTQIKALAYPGLA